MRRRINIAYLVYLSGDRRFLEVLGLYWHNVARDGFRVVFPLYWHFWKRDRKGRVLSKAQVIFPLVWLFRGDRGRSRHTLVGPAHWWKDRMGWGFNFWPLVFYGNYGRRGSHFTFVPFGHYRRYRDEKSYGFLTPVGFFYGSAGRRFRTWAMIPWAVGTATPYKAFTWVFPLNFYWRRQTKKHWLFLPLVYASKSPSSFSTFVFPLVWAWGSANSTNAVGFPLVWHFRRPGSSTTVAFPVYHARRGSWWSAGLLPLLYFGADPRNRSAHAVFFPLMLYRRTARGTRSTFLSPLLMWSSDRRARTRFWLWTVPPIVSYRSATSGTDVGFPLYVRHFDRRAGVNFVMVPPFVYYKDPVQRNTFLFPLWWNFKHRRTGAYVRALLPLFYQARSVEGRVTTVAGPSYVSYGAGQGWLAGLVPLLYMGSSRASRHFVLFPLIWHFNNRVTRAHTTAVGPLYWHFKPKTWHAGLAPLLYVGRAGPTRYHVLFPAVWHFSDSRQKWNTVVVPPLYAHWGKAGWMAGLCPVFFFGSRHGRSHHIVAPLFAHWHDRNKRSRTLLAGPGYYYRRGDDWGWGVFPFAFFGRSYSDGYVSSQAAVVPFLYMSRDRHRELLVTPLGGYSRSYATGALTGVAGPVVWHTGPRYRGFAVLPWVYHFNDLRRRVKTTVAFPFVRQVTPKGSSTVFFPFFWRFKDAREKSLVFFPFYWRLRQKKGWRADVFFPLYWDLAKGKKSFFMVGPYYQRKTAKGYDRGIWPLVHWKRNDKGSWFHLFPMVWYSYTNKTRRRVIVAANFYSDVTPENEHWGIWPLMFWGRKLTKRYRIGFPLYWDFSDSARKKRVLFVGPFFYHRAAIQRGFGLAPLFWYRSDTAGMMQVTLAPFFHFKSDPARFTLLTPLAGYHSDRAKSSSFGYAGLYFWRSDTRRRHDVVFPLFWRFHNRFSRSTITFIPPLLYWGQHSPEKKVDLWFPLLWMRRTVTSKTVVVFPFVWYDHAYHSNRTVAVFPFFYRKRNYPTRTTTWLFPPSLWIRTSPRRTSAILFPLFWHFGGRRNSTSVFFPLYWDFKRGANRSAVFFPLVWYFDRPWARTVVVLNTYYRRSKKDDTYRLLCVPLFDVGRPRPGDFQLSFLLGMFGYERYGHNKYIKLFWIPIRVSGRGRTRRRSRGTKAQQSKATYLPSPAYTPMTWSPL